MRTLGAVPANWAYPKDNFAANRAPTKTDDSTQGYEAGSMWIDGTKKQAYLCVDGTAANALWKQITQ